MEICLKHFFGRADRRRLLGLFVLVTTAVALPAFAQAACTFERPESWPTKNTVWVGDCKDSKADGLGVVKETGDGKVVRSFFGRIQSGKWLLGVIEQSDGYLAGQFSEGHLVEQEDRNVTIHAFDEAAKAAQSVAERYRKAGNLPSAKFYEAKSQSLKNQID
jgi:hypothetical protein